MKNILVTGCNGILGKEVVKLLAEKNINIIGVGRKQEAQFQHDNFKYISSDLTNVKSLQYIFETNTITHVVHLAAIAHVVKGVNITWPMYYRINTLLSKNLFEYATDMGLPIFFASTVDLYGIKNSIITEKSKVNPIGNYAKSKYLAEKALKETGNPMFLIARFGPIYSKSNRKDIHRRYYLKYPKLSLLIDKGMDYHLLSSENGAKFILNWINQDNNKQEIINVIDIVPYNTKEMIEEDRKDGMAKYVIKVPKLMKIIIYHLVNILFYKNHLLKFTAYKIINPMKFDLNKFRNFMK